jgi:hypothetical protein
VATSQIPHPFSGVRLRDADPGRARSFEVPSGRRGRRQRRGGLGPEPEEMVTTFAAAAAAARVCLALSLFASGDELIRGAINFHFFFPFLFIHSFFSFHLVTCLV